MSTNFKSLLTSIRSMVLKLLPAYKLFAGRNIETTTVKICEGTLQEEGSLTLLDDSFAGFVEGETYDVVLNGQPFKVTASQITASGTIGIADLTDAANNNGYMVALGDRSIVCMAMGTYIGATISVSQIKTSITERYEIKKLPVECLPNGVAKTKDVRAAKSAAAAAQSTANDAKTAAETAQTTANAAQTTANAAQTTAENALERVVEPYTRNVQMAPLYKNGGFSAWRDVVQKIL